MQNTLRLLIELQEIEKKVRTLTEQKARAPIQIALMKEKESEAAVRVEEKQEMFKSAQRLRKELEPPAGSVRRQRRAFTTIINSRNIPTKELNIHERSCNR